MAFWSKKTEEKEPAIEVPKIPKDIPVDRIINMRQQMSNNQIIQTLQREGYSSSEIFDAMNQADLVSQNPPFPYPVEQTEVQTEATEYQSYEPKEKIEELVEIIIEEKWNELVKDINKIIEWKNEIEKKINDLNKNIDDLKMNFDSLKKNILTKVSQYDQSMSNVGTSIKAMETAFSKILPTFTENVNELSRITKKLKG